MFRVGDEVKCVDNRLRSKELTVSKVYKVLDKVELDDNFLDFICKILNDEGVERWYTTTRFEKIKQGVL